MMLARDFDLVRISVGDIFRWHVRHHTKIGGRVRDMMAAGRLVDDTLVEAMIHKRLEQHDWNRGGRMPALTIVAVGAGAGVMPPCAGVHRDRRTPTEHLRFRQRGHRQAQVVAHGPCPKSDRNWWQVALVGGRSSCVRWPLLCQGRSDQWLTCGSSRDRRSVGIDDARSRPFGRLTNGACFLLPPGAGSRNGERLGGGWRWWIRRVGGCLYWANRRGDVSLLGLGRGRQAIGRACRSPAWGMPRR
jgi:hypothetical protein